MFHRDVGLSSKSELYNAERTLQDLIVFSVRRELKFKYRLEESVALNG
jgi:hypothetical protein